MNLLDALSDLNAILDAIERNTMRDRWEQKHYSDLTRLIMSSNPSFNVSTFNFFVDLRFYNLIAKAGSDGCINAIFQVFRSSAYASTTAVPVNSPSYVMPKRYLRCHLPSRMVHE